MNFGAQVRDSLLSSVAGTERRWLLAATLLVGALIAIVVSFAAPVTSVADVMGPTQLIMSVLVPLCGVLLSHALVEGHCPSQRPAAVIVAAVIYAAGVALIGFALAVLAAVVSPAAQSEHR